MVRLGICIIISSLIFVFVGCTAFNYKGPWGATTVVEAKNAPDEHPVVLRGKIERRLSYDRYMFSDDSGTIVVEIDWWVWGDITIDPTTTVEITGEIDEHSEEKEVEVRKIKKL
jgi:uncharacterized protein (TIGR00156 family)